MTTILKLWADIRARNWLAAFKDLVDIANAIEGGTLPQAHLDHVEATLRDNPPR